MSLLWQLGVVTSSDGLATSLKITLEPHLVILAELVRANKLAIGDTSGLGAEAVQWSGAAAVAARRHRRRYHRTMLSRPIGELGRFGILFIFSFIK